MKEIIEDYVSYEIAVLLKEKGFPQDYDKYHGLVYNEEDYEYEYEIQRMVLETRQVKAGTLHSYPLGVPEPKCYCSTQSLALKWLREVHNIFIDILTYTTGNKIQFRWVGYNNGRLFSQEEGRTIYFDSYEETVETALKYTLENLI